jgi:hypothetical protein
LRAHPGHGRCLIYQRYVIPWVKRTPCTCTEFGDAEPGRPDVVYTRDQLDRMLRYRYVAIKDRVYLLKDGRYGIWDSQSSEEWKARPGQRFAWAPPEG